MSDDESSGGEKEEQQAVQMRDLKKLSACVGCRLIKNDNAVKNLYFDIHSGENKDVRTVEMPETL